MCFRGILLAQTGKASDAVRSTLHRADRNPVNRDDPDSPTILAYSATAYSGTRPIP